MLVENGTADKIDPTNDKAFQRRAIVTYKNGQTAVIESDKPITLTEFAHDLASKDPNKPENDIQTAMYVDMGDWSEGWYRNPSDGKIISIGNDKLQTNKQTNWLVFKKPVQNT